MKNQSKVKSLFILFFAVFLLFSFACNSNDKRIVGKWERFDDESAGTRLLVTSIGSSFQGEVINVEGLLSELGFETSDIKWKHIKFQDNNIYAGQDLQKAVNQKGEVAYSEYIDIKIKLISEDILHVSEKKDKTNTDVQQQKWRRVK
ncbi:MAG: hypothetical protein ACPG5B_14615 [Chitinophagales bacterium]